MLPFGSFVATSSARGHLAAGLLLRADVTWPGFAHPRLVEETPENGLLQSAFALLGAATLMSAGKGFGL